VAEETKVSGKTGITVEDPVSESADEAPELDTDAVIKQAAKGDERCLPQVREMLSDPEEGPGWLEAAGSPAEWLRRSIVGKMAGKHLLVREAARKKLEGVQADLEGPNPTPVERLLAERAALCWLTVNWYEERFVNADDMSITQADYFQRRIHRAHQRFLSAVETLARVRKLAVPTLQLNIARNQVNVAGSGPAGGSIQ
jgi:hypothetical protein